MCLQSSGKNFFAWRLWNTWNLKLQRNCYNFFHLSILLLCILCILIYPSSTLFTIQYIYFNIYIYIYNIYMYVYISTFYAFVIKCHGMILSKRASLKKNPLYYGLFKNLLKTALIKSVKTIFNLNHSKTPKEQLKVE